MKKWKGIAIFLICVSIFQWGLILHILTFKPKPDIDFAGLEMANISSIYIYPDGWGNSGIYKAVVRLSDEDAALVVEKLNQIELNKQVEDDWTQYYGGTPSLMFHIFYQIPGKVVEYGNFSFSAGTTFYIINSNSNDAVAYHADYAIGDDFSYMYWQLHNKYFDTDYQFAKTS